MKKALSLVLTGALAVSLLAGCTSKPAPQTQPNPTPAPAANTSNIAKVGLGHITSIGKSASLGTKDGKDVLPMGQVDTIIAAVAFDKDGKVVSVTIDNAQTKVEFNKDLTLKTDVKVAGQTKVELGDKYGMKTASTLKKEWFEQIAALEKWMVGKKVADIKAMKVTKKDDAHPAVPDVAELKTSVTVSVEGYIAAVEEAEKNAVAVTNAAKVGLGHEVSLAKSKGYAKAADGKETLPLAQVDTTMNLVALDKDGKVVKAIIDNAQTKINFDNKGAITTDLKVAPQTKVELKEKYGMIAQSKIKKEWFEQAAALGKWMEGKTIADIKAMKTVKVDDAHPNVPDVAELKSSVTITVQDYIATAEEASKKAK